MIRKVNTEIRLLQLFDLQGRLLEVKMIDDVQANFDVSDRSTGVYFVKIATDKGVKVEKSSRNKDGKIVSGLDCRMKRIVF